MTSNSVPAIIYPLEDKRYRTGCKLCYGAASWAGNDGMYVVGTTISYKCLSCNDFFKIYIYDFLAVVGEGYLCLCLLYFRNNMFQVINHIMNLMMIQKLLENYTVV